MSIQLMTTVWSMDLPTADKMLLLSLADQANDDGVCWPSMAKVAARTGLTVRGAQKVLARLIEGGAVTREERLHRSNVYTVTPGEWRSPPEHGSPPPERCSPTPPNGVHLPPEHGSPRTIIETKEGIQSESPFTATELQELAITSEKIKTLSAAKTAEQDECRQIWKSYCNGYFSRYSTEPVRNAKVNALIKQLRERLGKEAAPVAEFYARLDDRFFVSRCHDLGVLVSQCESIRTRWVTGATKSPTENPGSFGNDHSDRSWADGLFTEKHTDPAWREGL